MKLNESSNKLIYNNTGIDFSKNENRILLSEVGPIRDVNGEEWTWTDYVCGDISVA